MKYLYHHGILGQKWGVRRFQNKDGSVTAEGMQRYYSDNDKAKNKKLTDKQKKILIAAGVAAIATVGGITLYKSGVLNKNVLKNISRGQKYASLNKNLIENSIKKVEIPRTPIPKVEVKKVEIPRTQIPKAEVKKVEIPKLVFGEDTTFSKSDLTKMANNFNKAFSSSNNLSKANYINEGQNFAEDLLRKNMGKLGM